MEVCDWVSKSMVDVCCLQEVRCKGQNSRKKGRRKWKMV